MPLGDFEREVLRLLAVNRNPDSFVGGATVLHQDPASLRASRDVQEFRDYLDALYLHERHLHLAALAWAAAAKDPGFTPELIADWARRGNKFRPEDYQVVRLMFLPYSGRMRLARPRYPHFRSQFVEDSVVALP